MHFLFKLIIFKQSVLYSKLCKYNKNSTQIGVRTRNYYDTPIFNKNVFKYSFTRISINILTLNLFLHKYIKETQEQIDNKEFYT